MKFFLILIILFYRNIDYSWEQRPYFTWKPSWQNS